MADSLTGHASVTMGGQSVMRIRTDETVTLLRCQDCFGISLAFSTGSDRKTRRVIIHVSNLSSKVCVSVARDINPASERIDYMKAVSLFLNDDYVNFLFDYGKKERFYLDPKETDLGGSTEYYLVSAAELEKEYTARCENIVFGGE